MNLLSEYLMDSDINEDFRINVLDPIGVFIDGIGFDIDKLIEKTGIPYEHAAAILGNRDYKFSIRSVNKVLNLFNFNIKITVDNVKLH